MEEEITIVCHHCNHENKIMDVDDLMPGLKCNRCKEDIVESAVEDGGDTVVSEDGILVLTAKPPSPSQPTH